MKYCPNCGNRVEEAMRFCPNCGHTVTIQSVDSVAEEPKERRSTITIERTEPTYYSDENGVRISTTRLLIGSTTYAMANIASVRTHVKPANRTPGILLAIGGFATISVSAYLNIPIGIGVGVLFFILGIAWALLSKPTYFIRISSSSTETDAIGSRSKEYIAQVARAINEALIQRG